MCPLKKKDCIGEENQPCNCVFRGRIKEEVLNGGEDRTLNKVIAVYREEQKKE